MTDVSLEKYIERVVELEVRRLQELHDSQSAAAERALKAASDNLETRLERMNEFRDQIQQERSEYLRRDQFAAQFDAVVRETRTELAKQDVRLRSLEDARSNLNGRFAVMTLLMGVALAALTALFRVFWK